MAQDFNVSMRLTLVDTASAQLKDFLAQLQGVEKSAPTINRSLSTFNRRLETTGKNAERAATGVNSLVVMLMAAEDVLSPLLTRFNGLVNELRGVNQAAGNTARNMGKLEMNMQGAGNQAQRIVVPLQDVNAELQSMATHAGAAGTQLGTVRSQMRGMGNQAQQTTNHVNTLADSLKGVAKLWGALKIEEGLKGAGKEGVAYENTRYRLDNLNLGPANNKTMIDASNAASKAVPQMDRDHMLTLALDLHNATGSVKDAALMLQDFAKAEYAMRRSLPKDGKFTDRDMLSVAKFLEQRGATQDPARLKAELDMVTKIISATQGRVNPAQLLGNIQYSKFNLGQTMDLGFMPIFAALIERNKANGGSGGTEGTALTSLLSTVVAGKISHQMLPEWSKMGLINRDKVQINDNGTIKRVEQGAVVGADLFLKNPYLWIQQVLLPAMQRAGVNIKDDKAVVQKLTSMFGNRNAAQAAGTMATQQQFLEKDAGNITNSRGYQQQYDAAIKTATGSVDTIKARMHELGVIIGSQLLPLFEPLLKAVSAFVKDLVNFASNHQIIAAFAAIGAGITGIVLAISGVKNVFGVVGNLTTALTGMGSAAKGAAAAVQTTVGPAQLMSQTLGYGAGAASNAGGRFTRMGSAFRAAGGVISATCGVISRGMLRLIPIVGQIAMAYSLADVLAHLKVGGVEIINWVIGWGDTFLTAMSNAWVRVENAAKSAWSRIKSVFTGGASQSYDAATKATIDANNRALEQRLRANGMTRTGLLTINAAPPPKKPVHNVDPNGHHRATYAPSPDLQAPFDIQKHKKAGKGRKGPHYNADASEAKQDYRLQEDALRDHLDAIKRLYDAGKMSIADYYKQKLNYTNQGIDLEIRALEKERAALMKDPSANKNQIDRLGTDIQLKQREKARQDRDIQAQQHKDINDLKEKEVALDEQLLALQGKSAEARAMKQSHKADKDRAGFAANLSVPGATQAVDRIDQIKQIEAAQTQLAVLREEIKQLEELERLAEQKIDNAVKAGTLTPTDAANQKDQLRRNLDAQIMSRAPAMQVAAAGTQNQNTINQVSQQIEAAKGGMQQLTPMAKNLMDVTQNAFTTLFEGLTKSHAHLKDLIAQTFRSIAQGIDQLVSKILAQKVAAELFGVDQSGNSTGQGIGSLFASLFSGSSSGAGGSSASGMSALVAKFVGGSYASGTDYVPHDMLAIIHKGEAVVPAHVNSQRNSVTASKQSGVTNIHFHGLSSTPSQQTLNQIQSSVALGIQRANKRNN